MPKDYKGFSGIAKTRFRGIAKELDYKQLSGTFYAQDRGEWFNVFFLQKSSGNDFFYVSYGIGIPYLWSTQKVMDENDIKGTIIGFRLEDDYHQGFDCETKQQVEESALKVADLFKAHAIPWLNQFNSLLDIADFYFYKDKLSLDKIGHHEWGLCLEIANYGLMLFHGGDFEQSHIWLKEAERLYQLPVYVSDEGRIVHERPKYARKYVPEEGHVRQLHVIQSVLECF